MKFTNTVTVERAPADVFAFLAEFENIPQWNYAIARTWKVSDGPIGVGSTYHQERTVPNRSEEAFRVTAYEPDRRLAIDGTLGPFAAQLTYQLDPARLDPTQLDPGGEATVITNEVDLQATGAARLVAPLATSTIKNAVAENLHVLKRLLEGR